MLLEVGMFLYKEHLSGNTLRYEVTRVTAKRAFVGIRNLYNELIEIEFDREVSGSSMYPRGSGVYSKEYYKLETPELIEKYKRSVLLRKFDKFLEDRKALSNEKLEKILEIMKE